jgi:predicted Fe-Mo cluster-binding NifX family protein
MKIALTVTSPSINADIDPLFGRGAYLLIVDSDTQTWEAHENPGISAPGGAGIKAAQFITEFGVKAAISGDFGPHAFTALKSAGISMYLYGDSRTAIEAIKRFKAGQLQAVGAATRGDCDHGHYGQDA